MSNDEVRWCENECENDMHDNHHSGACSDDESYIKLPVYHIDTHEASAVATTTTTTTIKNDYVDDDDDQISVINIHKHRKLLNRDSRHKSKDFATTASDSAKSHRHSLKLSRKYYQFINVCFNVIVLHVFLCNIFVTSVNCDELMESVGARGHFTHTWAVHIPGGESVARQVADDHEMNFRGKVS
jgi:hypothetical protein